MLKLRFVNAVRNSWIRTLISELVCGVNGSKRGGDVVVWYFAN